MAKNKKNKIDLNALQPLRQNPFAQLGDQFNLSQEKDAQETTFPEPFANEKEQPMLLVRKEKRKKGKMVTCIYHLETEPNVHLKTLKKTLGTGGTFNGECLEIQGDHRQTIGNYFLERGFKVRQGN